MNVVTAPSAEVVELGRGVPLYAVEAVSPLGPVADVSDKAEFQFKLVVSEFVLMEVGTAQLFVAVWVAVLVTPLVVV